MKLRELTLGPIVGETTPQRTRIWGRGDAHIIEDAPRRCFGAIRYRKYGAKQWQKHQIIKMNPNFEAVCWLSSALHLANRIRSP